MLRECGCDAAACIKHVVAYMFFTNVEALGVVTWQCLKIEALGTLKKLIEPKHARK